MQDVASNMILPACLPIVVVVTTSPTRNTYGLQATYRLVRSLVYNLITNLLTFSQVDDCMTPPFMRLELGERPLDTLPI